MSCDPSTCTCGEQLTLDSLIDPIGEAVLIESTKWAKLIYALGFPMDFTNPDTIELLDDDMIHEISVAWYDAELTDGLEPTSTVEDYEEMIREEIGL